MLTRTVSLTVALAAAAGAQTWQLRTARPANANFVFGAAYDEHRAVTVIVTPDSATNRVRTWEWDGGALGEVATPNRPQHEYGDPDYIDLVYDPVRRRVLMLRGVILQSPGQELFAFDGRDWSPVAAVNPIPVGFTVQVAFDRRRSVLVAWTGGNVHEFDGTTWTAPVAPGPGRRQTTQLVFDEARQVTLLFGGRTGSQPTTYDPTVWEWDGARWRPVTSLLAAREHQAAAYDATLARPLMFGGEYYSSDGNLHLLFNDTEEWDGIAFAPVTSPPPQQINTHAEMVHDLARGRTVLFEGRASNLTVWELVHSSPAGYVRIGSGCAGSAGELALEWTQGALARIGQPVMARVSHLPAVPAVLALGVSTSSWGGLRLPFDLAPLGAPGCIAYTSVQAVVVLAAVGGEALWQQQVPAMASLLGQRVYAQVWANDAAANAAGLVTSNAIGYTIGAR